MQKKKSFSVGNTLEEWEQLTAAYSANQPDLQHLEGQRAELESLLDQARSVSRQQESHTAGRQDMSRQLEAVLERGRKLATFLRVGAKERYGNRSEKLVEFGVQPLRTRRPPKSVQPPPGPESTHP
jgi:hypothetical protein